MELPILDISMLRPGQKVLVRADPNVPLAVAGAAQDGPEPSGRRR